MSADNNSRTVQDFIDERPIWHDGTPVASAPMTRMQWRIWGLASAGKFFEGMVVFMSGVALPLIALEFHLGPTARGLLSASVLFGILVGATALGSLADLFGRKAIFIGEMAIFCVFLILLTLSPNFPCLLIALFGLGLSLGCDYPTAHLLISESIPSSSRGRLVLSAFSFQAVGALAGTALGLIILRSHDSINDWRWMYIAAIFPALVVLIGRFFIPQSAHWLLSQGRLAEAERMTKVLLNRHPPYPKEIKLKAAPEEQPTETKKFGFALLFSKPWRRATILASVPWLLQDLGTYGIGIFTPTILAATIGAKSESARNLADVIHNDILGARGAAVIDVLLILGIICAVLFADRLGRIRLQILGFIGCALGLALAAISIHAPEPTRTILIFSGFMLFNFMTNLGPNAMTYLIAGEVFPTHLRGVGAGFAASFAKIGAVTTSFLFPILLHDIGTTMLLYGLICTSLLGAWVTWRYRIETTGINLETVGAAAPAPPKKDLLSEQPVIG